MLKTRRKYKPRVWVTGENGSIMQSGDLGIRYAYAYYQKNKNEATTYRVAKTSSSPITARHLFRLFPAQAENLM